MIPRRQSIRLLESCLRGQKSLVSHHNANQVVAHLASKCFVDRPQERGGVRFDGVKDTLADVARHPGIDAFRLFVFDEHAKILDDGSERAFGGSAATSASDAPLRKYGK